MPARCSLFQNFKSYTSVLRNLYVACIIKACIFKLVREFKNRILAKKFLEFFDTAIITPTKYFRKNSIFEGTKKSTLIFLDI